MPMDTWKAAENIERSLSLTKREINYVLFSPYTSIKNDLIHGMCL
jgi:hypothetical protein